MNLWYRIKFYLERKVESIIFGAVVILLIVIIIWSTKDSSNSTMISEEINLSKIDSIFFKKEQEAKSENISNISLTDLNKNLDKDTLDKVVKKETTMTKVMPRKKLNDNRKFGNLKVITTVSDFPISASVFVDGNFRGKSNNNGSLKIYKLRAGSSHSMKISKDGFKEWQGRVKVVRGRTIKISAQLSPKQSALGKIEFLANPEANIIFVDGKKLPQGTPFSAEFPVGVHRVRYINTKLASTWETKIFLDLDEKKVVHHLFKEKETGYLIITLANAHEYGYGYVYIDGVSWQDEKNNTTPFKTRFPVGKHKVAVRRKGFISSPIDTTILIEKDVVKRVSFILIPEKS